MKTCVRMFCLVGLTCGAFGAAFQNLGFDDANTNNVSDRSGFGDYFGPASELVPGWQLYSGTNLESAVGLNAFLPGLGYSSLMQPNNSGFGGEPLPAFGRFSLALFPGYASSAFDPYTLIQRGDIPSDTKSIRFVTYGSRFDLQINGTPVQLSYTYGPPTINPNTRQADVAGDVSLFAGQTAELRFTTLETSGAVVNGLDSISFSPIPIPEPSALLLFSLGSLSLLWFQRRRM